MDTPPQLPTDLITTAEAAKLLPGCRPGRGMHLATVFRLLNDGRLRGWKLGRRTLVSRSEVLALIVPIPPRKEARHVPGPTRAQQERVVSEVLRRHGLE